MKLESSVEIKIVLMMLIDLMMLMLMLRLKLRLMLMLMPNFSCNNIRNRLAEVQPSVRFVITSIG